MVPRGSKVPWIDKIELRGFKSFGNSKIELPLSRGLTAIIGRNGHGKSNITDALSFVFGGRSAKSMRGERYTDFIYSKGGRILAPYAEVTIHINNRDGGLALNTDTVTISRRVDKTGRCVYRINGRRVDRQDVVDLLSPVMGSPDDVNFVMQGQIKKVFSMNPLERRQIIDQLAGVSEYDEKREKIQRELEHVDSNLKILRAKMEEIGRQVESLRGQAQAYIKYRELRSELERVEEAYLRKRLKELEQQMKRVNSKLKQRQDNSKYWQKKAEELNRRSEDLDQQAQQLWGKAQKRRTSGILAKIAKWQNSLSFYNQMLKQAQRKRAGIEQELNKLRTSPSTKGGLLPALSKIREIQNTLQPLVERLTKIQDLEEARKMGAEIAGLLKQIDSTLGQVLIELNKQRIKTEDTELAYRILRLESELGLQHQQIREFSEKIEEYRRKIKQIEGRKEKSEQQIQLLEDRALRLQEKAKELRKKARDYYGKALEISSKRGEIEGRRARLEQEIEEIKKRQTGAEDSELMRLSIQQLKERKERLETQLREVGDVNPRALQDLKEQEARFTEEETRVKKLEGEQQTLMEKLLQLDQRKKEVFMRVFNLVAEHFSEIFYEISGGCSGQIILENPENPFEGGLEIQANFDGGPSRGLSGGQQTLTAVALLLALQRFRPSTFYVLDEMDESLDSYNRKLVAQLLKRYSKESQILVVTLHNALAAVSDRVFGVVKRDGVSRIYSVELSKFGD